MASASQNSGAKDQFQNDITKEENMLMIGKSKLLEENFIKVQNKKERNHTVHLAYLNGYSQIEIANRDAEFALIYPQEKY
jgi:hypothetical protein